MASRSFGFVLSGPFVLLFFEDCVWIIVRLEDPNMAHYKIFKSQSLIDYFYLLVFDRIHDVMCLNRCPGPPAEI